MSPRGVQSTRLAYAVALIFRPRCHNSTAAMSVVPRSPVAKSPGRKKPAAIEPTAKSPGRAKSAAATPTAADLERMITKGARIAAALTEVYPIAPKGFLDHRNTFTLLVAVLMSAQTTDIKVNEVTPALFDAADNPTDMAALGQPAVLEMIKSVGLSPGKSKNILGLSQILVENHGGEVPRTFEELEALPGVGHKTASVVMMQAFGHPAFPVGMLLSLHISI
jgi:HhH-GPD superfamily base excision DNA repair protein